MTAVLAPALSAPPVAVFLARHGHSNTIVTALPGDASPRSYARLAGADLLLMQDRTDPAEFASFVRLARHLRNLGLSAPRVSGADPATGLALIEDFGTATYGRLLNEGHDETALYELAVDTLAHLHSTPDATNVTVPGFDMDTLLQEVSVFSNWFVPVFAPHISIAAFDKEFRALWRTALTPVLAAPPALVLRDFHIDNLMLLKDRAGIAACGVLDFQDGATGAAEYDLVSLLQDARRDLAHGLEETLLRRYLAVIPARSGTEDEIMQRYYLLGAQRHTRLMGLFPRLGRRDGKPGYLRFLPRVVRQMQQALSDAQLTDIATFLDTQLPGWREASAEVAQRT